MNLPLQRNHPGLPSPRLRPLKSRKRQAAWLAVSVSVLLSGCAQFNDMTLGWFATKRNATLVMQDRLLSGEVVLVPDRSGRAQFTSQTGPGTASAPASASSAAADAAPVLQCSGNLRYTATLNGTIDLRCSDGSSAVMSFVLLSETRGYAYALPATQEGGPASSASLVFGLTPQESIGYLRAGSGRRIVLDAGGALALQ